MGGPGNLYQWQADGANISGETSEILMLPNVTATTGGMYTCVVTNIAGSNNASTFVFIFPYFINHPHSDQVSVGSAVILICDAVSFPSPDYLWQRADGGNISSDTVTNERNLSISSVEYGDEGGYFCNASVGEDSIQSQIAIVTGNCIVTMWSCALYREGRRTRGVYRAPYCQEVENFAAPPKLPGTSPKVPQSLVKSLSRHSLYLLFLECDTQNHMTDIGVDKSN